MGRRGLELGHERLGAFSLDALRRCRTEGRSPRGVARELLDRAGERFRVAAEQPVHFFGRFQVAIGETLAPMSELVDGDVEFGRNDRRCRLLDDDGGA